MITYRFFGFLCLSLAFHLSASGQGNFEKLQSAFVKSYELEGQGEYTRAVAALKAAYDPEMYELNLRLGWLNYMAGNFTESSGFYRTAISLKPLSVEARLGLVLPVSSLGNWDEVLGIYQDILEIDPKNSTVNYRLGSLYYYREEYKKAEQHLETVVNLYPFDYDSLLMLAWTKLQMGKNSEAQLLFQKVLLYAPEDSSALEGLELLK